MNVTVTTPGGTSATSPADQFTYLAVPPSVVSLQRFGFHAQPTSLVLTFSSALDATTAQNVNNYQIVTLGGRGKNGRLIGHVTPVASAVYDPATLTVTLFPAQRLDIHNLYQLTVDGMPPGGLTGATGVPLAGQVNGVPGTSYVAVISGKNLAGPAPGDPGVAAHSKTARHRLIKDRSASAVDHLLASGKLSVKEIAARRHGARHHLIG